MVYRPGLPSMRKADYYVGFNETKTQFTLSPIHSPVLISLRNNGSQSVDFDIEIPENSINHSGNSEFLSPVYLFIVAASVSFSLVALSLVGYFLYRHFRPSPVPNSQGLEMTYMPPGILFRDSDFTTHLNQVCPVCLDGFAPQTLVQVLECLHVYHSECAQQWMAEKKV